MSQFALPERDPPRRPGSWTGTAYACRTPSRARRDRVPRSCCSRPGRSSRRGSGRRRSAYLSRHYRVVTFDGRGSGDSGRPEGAAAYTNAEYAADALAVLDATGTDAAVARRALLCGRLGGARGRGPPGAGQRASGDRARLRVRPALTPTATPTGGASRSTPPRAGRSTTSTTGSSGDYDDFVRFFFSEMFTEPHSTKQIEDCVGWAHEIAPQTLADTTAGRLGVRRRGVRADRAALRAGARARCSSSTAPTTTSVRTRSASGSPS